VGSGVFFKVYQGATDRYTDKGLVAGKSYTYKCAAINAAGQGPNSASVVTTASSIPGKISIVNIVTQSKTALKISWSAPSHTGNLPFSEYLVKYDQANFVYGSPVTAGLTTEFTLSSLPSGKVGNYIRFRVATKNSLGTGPYSDEI